MKVKELINYLEKLEDEEAEVKIIDDKDYILDEEGNSIDKIVEIIEYNDKVIRRVYIITE